MIDLNTLCVSNRNTLDVELHHTLCVDIPSRDKRDRTTYIINLLDQRRILGRNRNQEAAHVRYYSYDVTEYLFLYEHGRIYFLNVSKSLRPLRRSSISFLLGSKERNLEHLRMAALEVALIHRILSISSLSMILNSLFDLISSKRVSCVLILLSRKQKRRIMKLVLMEEN